MNLPQPPTLTSRQKKGLPDCVFIANNLKNVHGGRSPLPICFFTPIEIFYCDVELRIVRALSVYPMVAIN